MTNRLTAFFRRASDGLGVRSSPITKWVTADEFGNGSNMAW